MSNFRQPEPDCGDTKSPVKVLLIDDDEEDYILTRQWLGEVESRRYDLHWVDGYDHALEAIARERYDIFLLDYRLGQHSGLDLLKELTQADSRVPVILMTGAERMDVDIEGMRLGATDYLVKGQITPDLLERAIRYAMARKETEALLQEAKEAAEEANRAKTAFLSNISHELRTPLAVIIGNAELLRDRDIAAMDPDEIKAFMSDVHGNARYLLDLINDLLDLSKAEADRIELEEDQIALAGVIDDAVGLARQLPNGGGLTFECEVDPALQTMFADPTRLKQILVNLLTNAVKFTEDGGKITVSAFLDRRSRPTLEITDTGVGISEDDLRRITEPFVQGAGRQVTGSLSGSGLGLPLAKRLTELHGGALVIRSTPGIGTTVVLTFPAERAK